MKILIFCLLIGVSWVPRSNIIQMVDALKPQPNITGIYWKVKQVVNNQHDPALDYYWASIPNCELDDVMIFNEDGSICFFKNKKCIPEESIKECFSYMFDDRDRITITSDESEVLNFQVISVDDMHLVLRQLWSDGDELNYFDLEYERFGMDLVCK